MGEASGCGSLMPPVTGADLHALLAAKMMRSRAALPPKDLRGRVCLKRAVVKEKECLSSDLVGATRGHF